jgi:hypothetical protein
MKTAIALSIGLGVVLGGASMAGAQTYAPLVNMKVTGPDGQTQDVSARESNVATFMLKDGTAYELRPTIEDEPFSRVTVAIFKAATATEATSVVGEVQVAKGAAAVDSKTKPAFKIAVTNIEPVAPKKTS